MSNLVKRLEELIVERLLDVGTSLYALEGQHIYPAPLPQKTDLPAITYQKIPGGSHVTTHEGHTGLFLGHYQFDAYASTYIESRQLGDALIAVLGGWIGGAIINDDIEFFEPDTKLHRVSVDTHIWNNLLEDE